MTCAAYPPPWAAARAAFIYEGTARKLVLQAKYADRLDILPFLAKAMLQEGASLMRDADYVVPVPLHRTRFRRRRFNQAALLARFIARSSRQVRLIPDALIRTRATTTLAPLRPDERRLALEQAFKVAASARDYLLGSHIVLVDDVLTTGATASICATQLLQSGARRVDLLVAARTVKLSDTAGAVEYAEE